MKRRHNSEMIPNKKNCYNHGEEHVNEQKSTKEILESTGLVPKERKISRFTNKRKLYNFLKNERLKWVTLEDTAFGKAFKVRKSGQQHGKGVLFPGVTKRIEEVFAPRGYDELAREIKINKLNTKAPNMLKKLKSKCALTGMPHGSLVHKQIETFANVLVANLPIESFYSQYPKPDPCFSRFLQLLQKKKWELLASELSIYDEEIGCATSIDALVVERTTGQIALLEIKTGYEGVALESHSTDDYFPEPLNEYKACPYQMHCIQVAIMALMIKKKYNFMPDMFFIVHICPKMGITRLLSMPPWFYNNIIMEDIYQRFILYNVFKGQISKDKRKK